MIKLKKDEPKRQLLQKAMKIEIKNTAAATNIQKIIRGYKTRKTLKENKPGV
jgi:hypothetical protein